MISHGKIVKVRGNKGEVVLAPPPGGDTFSPENGIIVILESPKYTKKFEIESTREISGALVLKFANINTINEALKLVGYHVFTPGTPGKSAPEERIIGFAVMDMAGRSWGKIVNVDCSTINKILEIQEQEQIIYVPYDESIVKEIDDEQGIVIIDPPDGLKELNL